MNRYLDISPGSFQKARSKPLYVQIADSIKSEISRQGMVVGDVLPSMVSIAEQLEVHRHTVKSAMDVLEREGIVDTKHGRNIMIKSNITKYPVFQSIKTELSEHMAYTTGAKIKCVYSRPCKSIDDIPIEDDIKYDSYQQVLHVNSKKGHVFGYSIMYLFSEMFDKSPEDFKEKLGLRTSISVLGKDSVSRIYQTMTIAKASSDVAKYFKISSGDPVARFVRVLLDNNKKAAYVGDIYYPSNAIEIRMDMI